MHPLAPNLEVLSDEEFHTKRSEIQTRLNYAYRIGNTSLVNQLSLLAQDYQIELERRNQKMMLDAQKSGRVGKDGDDSAKDLTR